MMQEIVDFIQNNWENTIRFNPEDTGDLIGLPRAYSVPCTSHMFQEMYYWDTYFTNIGFLLSDRLEQAKNNTENIAFLIDKYGYMPNGNRRYYLSRSQPPFFTRMVADIYSIIKDREWLDRMYRAAEKEYTFWQKNRMTSSGLNRYSGNFTEDMPECADELTKRFGIETPGDAEKLRQYAECMLAFSESGWDCNSRFGLRAHEFNPVELNTLLYGMEKNMAYFSEELKNGKTGIWNERAAKRKDILDIYMWNDEKGLYCDYDFIHNKKSDHISAAAFYPLFTMMCTKEQAAATVRNLHSIENPYGVSATEKRPDSYNLQWDYPHGWACLQFIVIKGLENYGYSEAGLRIAAKYCRSVEKNFKTTRSLWEKYDTVTGDISVTKEYESPQMMGWSAGVYLYCKKVESEAGQ